MGGAPAGPGMRFEPDETVEAIVQTAAGVLDGEAAGADPDAAERTWKALERSGLLSLSVPTRLGGEGLGALASLVVLTEIGRRGAALPALATLALGVLPIVRWGTPDQQDELLPGNPVLTAGAREPGHPEPARPATSCTPDLVVTGTKVGVPYADRAKRILVPVSLTTPGRRTAVALVDPSTTGVTLTRTPASSQTPEWTVRLDGARATGLLGGGAEAAEDLYRLALAGACAVGDGAVAGALALTSTHVGSREQFGRKLASFQAVAQQIADVYVTARTLHLATLAAGWRLAEGLESRADLDVAGYWLAREAPAALRTCHHLHGGLGLDVTYPLHRYSSLVKDLVRAIGGAEHRLAALANADRGGRGRVHGRAKRGRGHVQGRAKRGRGRVY